MAFDDIEKKFKRKCSGCGNMSVIVSKGFGHLLCDNCSRIKVIHSQNNSLQIPKHLIRKHKFKNKKLYLENHKEGLLVRHYEG